MIANLKNILFIWLEFALLWKAQSFKLKKYIFSEATKGKNGTIDSGSYQVTCKIAISPSCKFANNFGVC